MSSIINLSEPPLPNGVLIGGVANFYTSIKPTTRVDGSALVVGDRWINPITGKDGYWNGTYFLKDQGIINRAGLSSAGNYEPLGRYSGSNPIFVKSLFTSFYTNTALNASNYVIYSLYDLTTELARVSYQSVDTGLVKWRSQITSINQVANQDTTIGSCLFAFFETVGTVQLQIIVYSVEIAEIL